MKCGPGVKKMKAGGRVRKAVPKGMHMMPDGSMMKDSAHKKMKAGGKVAAKPVKMQKGGMVPCKGCPNSAACRKAGKCMMEG